VKSSPYAELASELEMAKALTYLRQRDFAKAVETLKGFEKKDSKMAATASTNLSFLYYLVSQSTDMKLFVGFEPSDWINSVYAAEQINNIMIHVAG